MLIPRQVLEVGRVASKDLTRLGLHAIELERVDGVCLATATNGHALIQAKWTELDAADYPELPDGSLLCWGENGFKATVDIDDAVKVGKALPKRVPFNCEILKHAALVEEPNPNGHGVMVAGETTFKVRTNEAEFPNWRQIMPDPGRDTVRIGFNAVLLRDTLTAILATAGESKSGFLGIELELTVGVKNADCFPAQIKARNVDAGVEVTAIVMPARL